MGETTAMVIRFRILIGVLAAASALTAPAWATGSAIQQLRSTEGLRTSGNYGASTGGTGILTKHQRHKFGYGRTRNRVAPPN